MNRRSNNQILTRNWSVQLPWTKSSGLRYERGRGLNMTAEKEWRQLSFFDKAVEYCERFVQLAKENLDIAEKLPPSTEQEAIAMLAEYQDLDADFRQSLLEKLTSQPDYILTVEVYAEHKRDDLLRRREEILGEYENLHENTELVSFLKTGFYYEAATFEWRALMLVLGS